MFRFAGVAEAPCSGLQRRKIQRGETCVEITHLIWQRRCCTPQQQHTMVVEQQVILTPFNYSMQGYSVWARYVLLLPYISHNYIASMYSNHVHSWRCIKTPIAQPLSLNVERSRQIKPFGSSSHHRYPSLHRWYCNDRLLALSTAKQCSPLRSP